MMYGIYYFFFTLYILYFICIHMFYFIAKYLIVSILGLTVNYTVSLRRKRRVQNKYSM